MRLVRNVIRPALAERMLEVQRRLSLPSRGTSTRACGEIDAAIAAGDAPATAAAVRALVRERRERMLRGPRRARVRARAGRRAAPRRRYRLCLSAAMRSSSGGCVMNRRAIPLRATPETPNAES